jgi:hypothetical protein
MDPQALINALFGLIGILGGWTLNRVWTAVDHLQKQDQMLADKVQAIEVLVAGTYVKHSDLNKLSDALFARLDRIEMKLDGKADK